MATWSSCARKTDDGMCRLQVMPSPLVSPPGLCQCGGVSPTGNSMETIPSGPLCLDPQLRQIDLACLLLLTTLKKLIHWGFSPLAADSSASHGGRNV